MVIPVLNQLSQRQQWLDFCRREAPYCFIESPECLVDFQSTFLKITLFPQNPLMQDAVKYSLGSRRSMEPVWRLIKGCEWDLQAIINGLETMDFSSNVRDNSLLKVHTDLSVRKYFNREHCVVPPSHIGLLDPLMAEPNIWDSRQLARLITHQQFTSLRSEQKSSLGHHGSNFKTPDLGEITLTLLNPVENCIGHMHKNRLHIFRGKQPFISLIPRFIWPKPRLTP